VKHGKRRGDIMTILNLGLNGIKNYIATNLDDGFGGTGMS